MRSGLTSGARRRKSPFHVLNNIEEWELRRDVICSHFVESLVDCGRTFNLPVAQVHLAPSPKSFWSSRAVNVVGIDEAAGEYDVVDWRTVVGPVPAAKSGAKLTRISARLF